MEPEAPLGDGEARAGADAGAQETQSWVSVLSVTLPLRSFAGFIPPPWAAPLPAFGPRYSQSGLAVTPSSLLGSRAHPRDLGTAFYLAPQAPQVCLRAQGCDSAFLGEAGGVPRDPRLQATPGPGCLSVIPAIPGRTDI